MHRDVARITLGQIGRVVRESTSDFDLTGKLTRAADGGFTLTLEAKPTGAVPPEPEPEPPPDAIVIHPTGGDDTSLIQTKLTELPSEKTLILSGMFKVSNSIWFEGYKKTLMADPAKQSGILAVNASSAMNGPWGTLLCCTPHLSESVIRGLEFDAQSKQTQMVLFDGGTDNTIEGCYVHDVGCNPNGGVFAGIFSTGPCVNLRVIGNRVERTGSVVDREGVRGIWVSGVNVHVEGNTTRDTGHTGIAAEGQSVWVIKNVMERTHTTGTGSKICYRPPGRMPGGYGRHEDGNWIPLREVYRPYGTPRESPALYFAENTVDSPYQAGVMLQNCAAAAVVIENNVFRNCSQQPGMTFGAIYSTSPASNVQMRNNRIENCPSVGGILYMSNSAFTDNTITGGSDILYLERDCSNITLTRSGKASIGPGCSNVTVDGTRVA